MSTVAARAVRHLRTHGLESTLRRAGPALRLALYLHEYHRWEQLLLVEDRPHPPLADGLRFRLGDESDLALLSMLPSIYADDALDLLAQGTRWCLVLDDQGVVFTTWIYHGRAPAVAAPGGWFSLPDGVACQEGSLTENDGLKWPHCDGLNWPHLRPTGGRLLELHRARAEGARGNGIQGGAVRADQTGS
jgi:hypothetical protein